MPWQARAPVTVVFASVDAFPRLGGVSTMGHHLANAMARIGRNVVFVAPEGSFVPRELVREYSLLEDVGSRVRRRAGEEALAEDERIRELFLRVIDRYSAERVLLLHPFYYAVGALDAAHARDVPCSVYFHGFELRSQLAGAYPENHRRLLGERRIGTLRERVFFTIGIADEILVNSSYTASLFRGFECKPPVRVTGCGLPLEDLERELDATPSYDRAQKRERREALGIPGVSVCLAYVGRLVPHKKVERLLRLCRRSPSLGAVVIGAGPDEGALRSRVSAWGLGRRVRFLGAVPEEVKWRWLRAADFLCLLSEPNDEGGQVEGFGIALLEGAAAGAVPVSSGSGGMVDVVYHGTTGLVLPDDDAAAADLICRTAADPPRMQRLLLGAREQLRTEFTWSAVAERITEAW